MLNVLNMIYKQKDLNSLNNNNNQFANDELKFSHFTAKIELRNEIIDMISKDIQQRANGISVFGITIDRGFMIGIRAAVSTLIISWIVQIATE